MKIELTASMMCANYGNLEKEVRELEEGGIDSFHIDIMDGRYVPNNIHIFLKRLRKGDTVYIHPEAEYHPSTTLQKIIDAGMLPGIAINPGTSVETVYEMLRIVKKVLVMSVNPGNAGQMYLPYVGKKISKLLELKTEMKYKVYWDGACSADKIIKYGPKGMDGFVLGTTLLFGKDRSYKELLDEIRRIEMS